jgi:hypothetical protein
VRWRSKRNGDRRLVEHPSGTNSQFRLKGGALLSPQLQKQTHA